MELFFADDHRQFVIAESLSSGTPVYCIAVKSAAKAFKQLLDLILGYGVANAFGPRPL
jgi:hypothetical protein